MDPTETLEEVYSLLLIIGHVLADEGEGETALVILFPSFLFDVITKRNMLTSFPSVNFSCLL